MKTMKILVLCTALIFLGSCITIIEKYTLNKDGSGTLEYLIDMSELYSMMAAFSDSSGDMSNMELDQPMREALPVLEKIPGITGVELAGSKDNYTTGIKFNFSDAAALNKALSVVLSENNEGSEGDKTYVAIKGKTFTRFGLTSSEFDKDALLGETEGMDEETMNSVLESMKYRISVNFGKPVKKVDTSASYTIEDKTVTVEANFKEIFATRDLLKTTIRTK